MRLTIYAIFLLLFLFAVGCTDDNSKSSVEDGDMESEQDDEPPILPGDVDLDSLDGDGEITKGEIEESQVKLRQLGDSCYTDDDCEADAFCHFGGDYRYCSRSCKKDSDCPDGYCTGYVLNRFAGTVSNQCLFNKHYQYKEAGETCTSSFQCNSNICIEYEDKKSCSAICETESDCPEGWQCFTRDPGLKPLVDLEEYGFCAPEGYQHNREAGEVCLAHEACKTGFCGLNRTCTTVCKKPSDCPENIPCMVNTDPMSNVTTGYCDASFAGKRATTELCDNAMDCQGGFCLDADINQCTHICEKNEDCPENWSCHAYTKVRGEFSLCVPDDFEFFDPGNLLPANKTQTHCQNYDIFVPDDNNQNWYCSLPCQKDIDCKSLGWDCAPLQIVENGLAIPVCSPSELKGVGESCESNDDCAVQCLEKDGVCTGVCETKEDCPDNYDCLDSLLLGTVGHSQLKLCAPSDTTLGSDFGEQCDYDVFCASGLCSGFYFEDNAMCSVPCMLDDDCFCENCVCVVSGVCTDLLQDGWESGHECTSSRDCNHNGCLLTNGDTGVCTKPCQMNSNCDDLEGDWVCADGNVEAIGSAMVCQPQ